MSLHDRVLGFVVCFVLGSALSASSMRHLVRTCSCTPLLYMRSMTNRCLHAHSRTDCTRVSKYNLVRCPLKHWTIACSRKGEVFDGRPATFAIIYSVGNIVSLCGTTFLVGPLRQLKNIADPKRENVNFETFPPLLPFPSYLNYC